MFSLIFKLFVLVQIASIANAHSWVHCVKYEPNSDNDRRYNNDNLCRGVPRQWYKDGGYNSRHELNQEFGADRGFHAQINIDRSGPRCQGTSTIGFDANYGGEQNVVHYTQGETYTLNWPTKNHVAAECLNRFIPDTFLRLNIFKQQDANNMRDPSQDEFDRFPLDTSFGRDPHVNGQIDFKGFQNCPAFCENQDKSLCTGTFDLPADLEPGLYTFQWNWELNANVDQYATCWEAYVDPAPTTAAPETTTNAEPTTTNAEVTTTAPDTTFGVVGDACYTALCGCPTGGYAQSWCDDESAVIPNDYCKQSQSQCEGECGGVWCSLDAPIDPNAPCSVSDLKQDPDNNNFNVVCDYPGGSVPVGEKCSVNPLPSYVGGEVQCIGGTFKYTPATCISCCSRGNFLAPGTEVLNPYQDINVMETQTFDCPDGFDGTYKLLCTRQGQFNRVTLSDGACSVSCLASEAQRNYDMGFDDNGDNSDGLIATLIVIVVVLMVILITYVLYKEKMFCFADKESEIAGSINNTGSKIDFEYTPSSKAKPVGKKRESIERNL